MASWGLSSPVSGEAHRLPLSIPETPSYKLWSFSRLQSLQVMPTSSSCTQHSKGGDSCWIPWAPSNLSCSALLDPYPWSTLLHGKFHSLFSTLFKAFLVRSGVVTLVAPSPPLLLCLVILCFLVSLPCPCPAPQIPA